MSEQENKNTTQQEKDLYSIGKDLLKTAKNKLMGSEQAGSSVAKSLKVIGKLIIIFFAVGGCIGGGVLGCLEEPLFGDEALDTLVLGAIGAVAGLIVGALTSLFFLYFAELGENMKIAAKSTETTAQQVENGDTSAVEALKNYKELLDSGVITQEEFDLKKKELLKL